MLYLFKTPNKEYMKQVLIVCWLFACSCRAIENDQVISFIPGSYAKEVSNEYNIGYDTLIISLLNEKVYQIIRHSSFNRIRNGQTMPEKRVTEKWTALYNKDEQVLHETKKGKILSFVPDKNLLLVGSSEYIKIKNGL